MERQGYIGASDVPTILGLNLFKTKVELWEEKTGLVKDSFAGNLATDLGHEFEPNVANRAIEELKAIISDNILLIDPEDQQVTCEEFPILKARPDRYVVCKNWPEDDLTYILECKVAFSEGSRKKWQAGVPEAYYWQVQTQLLCNALDEAYIAALTEGPDFFVYKIKADYSAQQRILEECKLFWDCVESKTKPIIDKIDDKEKEYLTEDEDADFAIGRYLELKAEVDIRTSEMDQIKGDLGTFIQNASGYKHNGKSAVWVHKKPTLAFNSAEAEKYLREVYNGNITEDFYKEKRGFSYVRISDKNTKKL